MARRGCACARWGRVSARHRGCALAGVACPRLAVAAPAHGLRWLAEPAWRWAAWPHPRDGIARPGTCCPRRRGRTAVPRPRLVTRRGWGRGQGRVPTPPEDPPALLGGRAPAPWPGLSRRWPRDRAVPCAMAGPPSRPWAALATRLSPRPPGSHPSPPGLGNRAPAPVPGGRPRPRAAHTGPRRAARGTAPTAPWPPRLG